MKPGANEMSRLAHRQRQRRYLERKREGRGLLSRNAFPVRMETVLQLAAEISMLPRTTLLIPTPLARELIECIRRLSIRQNRMVERVNTLTVQVTNLRYQRRLTDRVIECRDLNEIAQWWLSRRDGAGKNQHASALAKAGALKRRLANPSAMIEAGKRGAEVRWARHRQAQGASAAEQP